MATMWLKILVATIRDASIDVEVENLNRLKYHLTILRVSWEKTEVKAVAEDMEIYMLIMALLVSDGTWER